jgi:hypothetical protein
MHKTRHTHTRTVHTAIVRQDGQDQIAAVRSSSVAAAALRMLLDRCAQTRLPKCDACTPQHCAVQTALDGTASSPCRAHASWPSLDARAECQTSALCLALAMYA